MSGTHSRATKKASKCKGDNIKGGEDALNGDGVVLKDNREAFKGDEKVLTGNG